MRFDQSPIQELARERVTLELMQVGTTISSRVEWDTVQVDALARMAAHRITTYVLADRLLSEPLVKHYETPSTWWQHFKRDHLPTYARWRPVKTERHTVTVDFERFATYPKANITLPALGGPVYIDRVTER